MKGKCVKRILSIALAVLLFSSSIVVGMSGLSGDVEAAQAESNYPYVYIHGLFGWGEGEGINNAIPYWGATACNLIPILNSEGHESYAASVGPLSSVWDRTCELYAQMTGTRVDYGAAHSAEHNHARYGRSYSEPLFEGWGEPYPDGSIKKVNLVGHSFGSPTARLLTHLLANGSEAEEAATDPAEISPLFTGGKGDWVNSVTSLCGANNGSTLAYIVDDMHLSTLTALFCFVYAGFMGRTSLNGFLDFHLEQFGLTPVPGSTPEKAMRDALEVAVENLDDSALGGLYPDGAKKLNDEIETVPGVYYFSYAYQTTYETRLGTQAPYISDTLFILQPFAAMMGAYSSNPSGGYPIDESWLPNDGLVSVVSALYPDGEEWVEYDPSKPVEPGIWNVMPVQRGDHGHVIGLFAEEEETLTFYRELTAMIEALPWS